MAIFAEYCTVFRFVQLAISGMKEHSRFTDLHPSFREFGQNPQTFCEQVLPCSSCPLPVDSLHTRLPQGHSEALSALWALLLWHEFAIKMQGRKKHHLQQTNPFDRSVRRPTSKMKSQSLPLVLPSANKQKARKLLGAASLVYYLVGDEAQWTLLQLQLCFNFLKREEIIYC